MSTLYEGIFSAFEKNNTATSMLIEEAYKENFNMMDRRVGQIMVTFNEQLAKNKKLSEESYRKIKVEIEDVLSIAKGIDDENRDLKKKIKD